MDTSADVNQYFKQCCKEPGSHSQKKKSTHGISYSHGLAVSNVYVLLD